MKQRNRNAYVLGVKDCLAILNDDWSSIAELRDALGNIYMVDVRIPTSRFKARKEEQTYYLLAFDHARDIVNSLEKRYITGSGDPGPRGYAPRGMNYYEDKNLFD